MVIIKELTAWVRKNPDRAAILFLIFFSGTFIFWNLGQAALIDWDESIYAGVSREMVERGDFLTLHWNKDTFFEKPPLYFWLTSLAYLVFGINEFAARFWSAVLGVVGVVAVYFFGKEMFGRSAGFASAIILASTVHWVLQSRNGTLDVPVATFIILALYFFWKAREKPRYWKFAGICLGLTFMTKSVVAVIPPLVMFVFAALEMLYDRGFRKYPLKGLLHFAFCILALVLPWHLAMYKIHGRAFIDEYFFYHILARTKGIEGHSQPWFWYFIVLQHWARHWYLALLGTLYLLAGLLSRDGVKKHWQSFFLFLWFLFTFLIFSVSQSKIEWYIVPVYPAMALLIGGLLIPLLSRYFSQREKIWAVGFLVVFCLVSLCRLTHLWKIDDYNRGIAETAKAMGQFSRSDDRLAIYGIAPGPPIFYSGHKVIDYDREGIFHSVAGRERFFALTSDAMLEDLAEKGLDRGLAVYKKSGGYILFGRD